MTKLDKLSVQLLLAALLGALHLFVFAPLDQWWLIYPSLVGFFLLLRKVEQTTQQFFLICFTFSLSMSLSTIHWVHVSMTEFGGMPLYVSLILITLLCAYLALFTTTALWTSTRLLKFSLTTRYLLIIPIFWLVGDWFRGYFLTGFPWAYLGYSHADTPLVGFAPILGVQGITLAILLICGAITLIIQNKHRKMASVLMVLIISSGFFLNKITYTTPQSAIDVALVQGNIDQNEKWELSNLYPSLYKYKSLSKRMPNGQDFPKPELVIWPESAVATIEITIQPFLQRLSREFEQQGITLITGIIDYNVNTQKYYNSIITLGKLPKNEGYSLHHENRYQKHQLLPIGEFVPFEDFLRPLAPYFNLPMSSFARGDEVQRNLQTDQTTLAPAVCYEIAFPELLRKNVHEKTGMLLTLSNDAWFNNSVGPAQHLQIARMRAIEFQRPLLRSTNTGITAIFDATGTEVGRIESNVADVLRAKIQPAFGMTPYQQYGSLPLYLFSLFGLIYILVRGRKIK